MRQVIEIERAGSEPSRIMIGSVGEWLPQLTAGLDPIVITDQRVAACYPELVEPYRHIVIGQGEESKNLDTMAVIYRRLVEEEADRGAFLLGIGGGIVTDITGFAASTYMRGVRFGFVATTLLAQVDASVGGKNGVNFDGYKNMVGNFNQPDFVVCDPAMLRTLPEREVRCGIAEAIKAGLIGSEGLFVRLESGYESVMGDSELLSAVIREAIEIKASVVADDFTESGRRKILNFGHTIGHAVEKCCRSYTHGEAVAIGCCHAAEISRRMGFLSECDKNRVVAAIERMGLPAECDVSARELFEALLHDKKRCGDGIGFVVLDAIGRCHVERLAFERLARLMEVEL